jgi:hypothetical protein
MHPVRKWDYRAGSIQSISGPVSLRNYSLPTTGSAFNHVTRGVEPCGLPRTLRTYETGRPSALGHGFEAGPRYEDVSAARPHRFNKTNPESTVGASENIPKFMVTQKKSTTS